MTEPPVTRTVGIDTAGLVVDGLTWRPHGRRAPTLRDVSLVVRPGERVLLVGASGSGKSTLLQAMAGLLDDTLGDRSGTVAIDGRPPDSAPGQVGLLLQDPMHALVAEHVGRDVAFGPENRRLPRSEVLARAETALAEVEFPYGADHRSLELSGGEMQRLALAGALALQPRVLLLDEPTAMLDPGSAAEVRDAVRRAAARGVTVVVVEHRIEGWADFCDRIVVLGRGGIVLADGPLAEVLASQADELTAAGVWVPGVAPPGPEPWALTERERAPVRRPGCRTALRATGVTVARPGTSAGPQRVLVPDLDLELARGTSVAVLGRSGSGKSTLLRVLAGLAPPAAGTVELATDAGLRPATEVARQSTELARSVGWLPQQADQLITRRTVLAEVLASGIALGEEDLGEEDLVVVRERAERLLQALGIDHLRDADPYQISGGEQRRLALAATLAHGPVLMLLDEPTVGQDRQTWAAVLAVIDQAVRSGSAVVATTHDTAFAARLDRTVDLGTPRGAERTNPDYRVRRVIEPGSPPAARANPLALLVVAAGGAVGSFFVSSWLVGALTLLASVLLSPLAVRRVRPALLRLIPVGIAALTVGWSTVLYSSRGFLSPDSLPVAAKEVLRICCLVVPGALLVTSLRPSALGDGLAQTLRLPHRPVVAATSGLLRLETLLTQWQSLVDIRRIRGLAPGRSLPARARQLAAVTVALLVAVLRSAAQMAVSMDARGFAGVRRRAFALGSPWQPRDGLCCLIGALLVVLPLVLSRAW